MNSNIKEEAAKQALEDIRHLLKSSESAVEASGMNPAINKEQLVNLLNSNFSKLDPNDDGISREELLHALSHPDSYSADECEMLRLIAKYFDTIINLSDDEEGEELRISKMDAKVLEQFLLSSNLTIQELHMWCNLGDDPSQITGPPPLGN